MCNKAGELAGGGGGGDRDKFSYMIVLPGPLTEAYGRSLRVPPSNYYWNSGLEDFYLRDIFLAHCAC